MNTRLLQFLYSYRHRCKAVVFHNDKHWVVEIIEGGVVQGVRVAYAASSSLDTAISSAVNQAEAAL